MAELIKTQGQKTASPSRTNLTFLCAQSKLLINMYSKYNKQTIYTSESFHLPRNNVVEMRVNGSCHKHQYFTSAQASYLFSKKRKY